MAKGRADKGKASIESGYPDAETLLALLKYSQSAAKIGGWQLDIETGNLSWTDETYRIHDTTPEEFNPTVDAGVRFYLLDSQVVLLEALKRAMRDGTGYALELEMHTTKGRFIEVYTTCEVTMEDGRPVKLTGIFQDITQRKKNERQLERERQRLASILETAIDGIIVIDDAGTIVSFNEAAENIFGYLGSEAQGKNVSRLMPEPHRSAHDQYLENFRRTGEGKIIGRGREVVGLRKNGETFPMDLSISQWMDGSCQMFTGVVRDLTLTKKMQAQLLQTQKMESVAQLSAGLAHDFNNLLGAMVANLELLQNSQALDQVGHDYLNGVLKAIKGGANITSRMLRFSRLQAAAAEPLRSHDVNHLLREMEAILHPALGSNHDVALTTTNGPLWVKLDPAEFENVVLNFGMNARDAMPEGGTLDVRTSSTSLAEGQVAGLEPGHYVELCFRDSGVGMSQEVASRIFEPFYSSKEHKGTGLGLAMALAFVQSCGGHILVDSEEGKGTEFRLFLPQADNDEAQREAHVEVRLPRGTETILLVEDQEDLLALSSSWLRSLGYVVLAAPNGELAQEIIESDHPIDLLVSDLMLPNGVLGTDLIAPFQARHGAAPIVLVSGFPGHDRDTPILARYLDQVLAKPYSQHDLALRIRDALDAASAHPEGPS